jgi:hypothetical protein
MARLEFVRSIDRSIDRVIDIVCGVCVLGSDHPPPPPPPHSVGDCWGPARTHGMGGGGICVCVCVQLGDHGCVCVYM